VISDIITITCPIDELKHLHLPELKKVIQQTNTLYTDYFEQKRQRELLIQERQKSDKEKLKNLCNELNFDF
jgi:vacuolar-type H+-ATPase subunit I/STV1